MTRDRPIDQARVRYDDKEHIHPRGRRDVQRGDEDVIGPGENPWHDHLWEIFSMDTVHIQKTWNKDHF